MSVRRAPNRTAATGDMNDANEIDQLRIIDLREPRMKREPIRVEPLSTYLERRRKGPICPVIVAGETVYVSGLSPFDPAPREVGPLPFARQVEIVLDQMKLCLEAA